MPTIITTHVKAPNPDFAQLKWRAIYQGDEGLSCLHGWGSTEAEAIADLKRLHQEMGEAEEDTP